MKKIGVFLAFALFALESFAQEIDLKQAYIRLESGLEQKPGDSAPIGYTHIIEINTLDKTIKVTKQYNDEVIFDLEYTSAFDGTSRSVQMQPGETLFMLRKNDADMSLVTYSSAEHTFSFISNANEIYLFGQIYIIEE
jgi:hypothetical protein